ncbi:START domain-containing protein [Entamoeba marina]
MSNYTPATEDEIIAFRKACVDNDGWKQVVRKDDYMIFFKKTEGTIIRFKFITKQLNSFEPEYIFSSYCDREYCKTLDSMDVLFDVIEKIDVSNEIIHRVQKMPMMDERDFVYRFTRYHNKSNTDFIMYSKSFESSIPAKKGAVRGKILCTGSLITKNASAGTLIYTVSEVDMGGKIPSGLMGETMIKQMGKKMIKKAKKNIEGYKKYVTEHPNDPKWWLETVEWMNK